MARYIGPVCRQCRREGVKLYLKGDKCYGDKCPFDRRGYIPGEHGQGRRSKQSEYGLQLREKQKARRIYGLMESQFHRYYKRAESQKGVAGANLLILLERRLDNAVYRLGLADSRTQARQLVRHGHFTVNGRTVNIPSFQVKPGDTVAVQAASKTSPKLKEIIEDLGNRAVPAWLELLPELPGGRVLRLPNREDIEIPIQEHLIIELYSR